MTHEPRAKQVFPVNGKTAGLLVGLLALICGTVIATDLWSRRERAAGTLPATTATATQRGGGL